MNDVRLPIETSREGNKITKVCVEDVHKMINRVIEAMNKAYNNSADIVNGLKCSYYNENNKTLYGDRKCSLIVGRGTSQPCLTDAFDEQIGNDIAFMKAKLNANIKKHNLLCRVWNEFDKLLEVIDTDLVKVDDYICDDLMRLRQYNHEYLQGIEYELGIEEDDEVQE